MRTLAIAFTMSASLLVAVTPVTAGVLDELVGFTIVSKKTVVAYVNEDGSRKDGFEGCDYGRIIVFEDDTGVVCKSYRYKYSYRPDAFIVSDGSVLKMIVGDEVMVVGQIR